MPRTLAFLAALTMATGCSVMHPVADDYSQYLAKNAGESKFQTVKAADQYYLPPATQNHHYEFRAATTGYANVWVMEFGKVLDATMQSKDATAAFGSLAKASTETQGSGNTLVFELQNYTFDDFAAHVTLAISVKNAQGEVFKQTYTAHGKSQGGKMFLAGAFGMKNAVQQSTKLATDEIIGKFIRDLKASGKLAAATQG
ncbi:hypothetical protein G4G28_22925 [Massilia sp. Dwa41.01b]|nr:hypothetical protein G4G28_22925 [Massilia sp. Dwa41.01b]QNB01273.1 hypothetical protein G4G31_01995 [Massilia sp. Se16.2.3]